jgi:hypothetical protein
MRFRTRRRAVRGALSALSAAAALAAMVGSALAAEPIRASTRFDPDAALGSASAVEVSLHIDRSAAREPLDEVRFAYPRGLGVVSSGLGLAACTRPASDFVKVLISAPRLGGCSPNAVMGIGTARALVKLTTGGQVIPEYASVTLLSGALERGRLGLVAYVDGRHPFGGKLAFAGDVRDLPAPYGGELTVRLPAIPGIADLATIYVVDMQLTIGSHAIRYYERRGGRRVAYHPQGVLLPSACPAHGFRFRVGLGFADGTRRTATSLAPCPSRVATPSFGR